MDIKRVATDAINETIVLTVPHMDYKGQVAKRINEKMPLATVKGFRKGQVPKGLVEKQYGAAIKIEEVNKVVDLALQRFIQSERLNLLGTPLPKVNENFSWDKEELVFEYEIGLVPEFEIDLEAKNNIVKYTVLADEDFLKSQIERIQKQFGPTVSQDQIKEGNEVSGTFTNQEQNINNRATIDMADFADPKTAKQFIGKKVGDVVTLQTQGLYTDVHKLMEVLNVSHDIIHDLDIAVTFTIDEVIAREPAELNQELFDKLFGAGTISSQEELKAKIKEDAEKQFAQQADQKLMTDVQEFLIENTKFDLPKEFLVKWLQTVGDKKLNPQEAEAEYTKSEKGLRFQLIEGKSLAASNIQVNFEDLKSFTSAAIRQQMAQFGQTNPTDQEVEQVVARVLSNQEEVKRMSEQVVAEKMLQLFVQKANPTTKEVTYEQFVAAMYGE